MLADCEHIFPILHFLKNFHLYIFEACSTLISLKKADVRVIYLTAVLFLNVKIYIAHSKLYSGCT